MSLDSSSVPNWRDKGESLESNSEGLIMVTENAEEDGILEGRSCANDVTLVGHASKDDGLPKYVDIGTQTERFSVIDGNELITGTEFDEEWPIWPASISYRLATFLFDSALDTFFSTVEIVNQENIPPEGPCILFMNHNNQFVDGMIMARVAKRPVSFIVADATYSKPFHHAFCKALGAVPVKRPQDLKTKGVGKISKVDFQTGVLHGEHTRFTTIKPGSLVSNSKIGTLKVLEVHSDICLKFSIPQSSPFLGCKDTISIDTLSGDFELIPKVDQSEIFDHVVDALSQGRCIGIFPEGGSHDRTELLPLKVGVAIMALEARCRGIPVKLIPVGATYFSGHVFRSKAFVDVGKCLHVSDSLLEMYRDKNGSRIASSQLLDELRTALEMVTLNAPDFETLKLIRTARRIYQGRVHLSAKEYVELNIRFTSAYQVWKEEPAFSALLNDIREYLDCASSLGLTDKEIRRLRCLKSVNSLVWSLLDILYTSLLILIVSPLLFPGLLLNIPIVWYVRRKLPVEMNLALKGSSVKVAARDVSASVQIISAVKTIPILHASYSIILFLAFRTTWHLWEKSWAGAFFATNAWWIVPFFLLYAWPKYTFKFCPRMLETVGRRSRLLPRYFWCIKSYFNSNHRGPAEKLRLERKRLTVRAQNIVEEFLGSHFDNGYARIINRNRLIKARSSSLHQIAKKDKLQSQ